VQAQSTLAIAENLAAALLQTGPFAGVSITTEEERYGRGSSY
jgi:hypothetical protein